jgi:hypothetical protein
MRYFTYFPLFFQMLFMINSTTFQQLSYVTANFRIFCGKNVKGRSFEMFIVSPGNWLE